MSFRVRMKSSEVSSLIFSQAGRDDSFWISVLGITFLTFKFLTIVVFKMLNQTSHKTGTVGTINNPVIVT